MGDAIYIDAKYRAPIPAVHGVGFNVHSEPYLGNPFNKLYYKYNAKLLSFQALNFYCSHGRINLNITIK